MDIGDSGGTPLACACPIEPLQFRIKRAFSYEDNILRNSTSLVSAEPRFTLNCFANSIPSVSSLINVFCSILHAFSIFNDRLCLSSQFQAKTWTLLKYMCASVCVITSCLMNKFYHAMIGHREANESFIQYQKQSQKGKGCEKGQNFEQ